jgi:hypothetical protein
MSLRLRRPLLAALAVAAVVPGAVLLARAAADTPSPDAPPVGAVLSGQDRIDLDAPPVLRGADEPAPDPAVDLTDPAAVATAYLVAAHAATPADAGGTHRRAAAYAVPGSPPAVVGVLVVDPPPPGAVRTAAVVALDLVAADRADRRRGYRTGVLTTTGDPGEDATVVELSRDVVVARRPDGTWLVASEQPATPDLPAGED